MPLYQFTNAELETLLEGALRKYQGTTEPLGTIGVWNGSFEQGPGGQYPGIEGWVATPVGAGNTIARYSADQYDGQYCVRGTSVAGVAPGYLDSARYLQVSEGITYYADIATRGSAAGTTIQFRMNCYTAARVYIATTNIVSGAIGAAWVWRRSQIGAGGGAIIAFPAGTRWIRFNVNFNWAAVGWAQVDCVMFGPVM